jgi:hypothetical protein
MLDDLELPQVQEIATLEQRVLAEHKAASMAGSLLQNMGRRPTCLMLWGVATGPEALAFTEKLEGKFRAGEPVPFTADILADALIEKMVIQHLHVQDLAGKPQRYAYMLTLREYIEPVEPESTSAVDEAIQAEALDIMDGMLPGLNIGLDFATGLERFVSPLSGFLQRLEQFNQTTNRP